RGSPEPLIGCGKPKEERLWRAVGVDGPQRHQCARMWSLKDTFEGAVHEQDSTDRDRYVEGQFPAARGEREGRGGAAPDGASSSVSGVHGEAGADGDWFGSLWGVASLGARAGS